MPTVAAAEITGKRNPKHKILIWFGCNLVLLSRTLPRCRKIEDVLLKKKYYHVTLISSYVCRYYPSHIVTEILKSDICEYHRVRWEWVVIGDDRVVGGVHGVPEKSVRHQGSANAHCVVGNRLRPHLQRGMILPRQKTRLELL